MIGTPLTFLALLDVKIAVGFHDDAPADVLRALTGIGGPPVNLSLWFLRDLFVSVIAVRLALPALARWPELLVLLASITVTDCVEPIIFRPAILLFAAMGAVCATRSTLSGWLTADRAIWIVAALAGLYFMAQSFPPDQQSEAENLIRRALLTVAVLMLTQQLAATRLARYLVQWERRIFETYLLHCALFGVLWVGWTLWIGGATEPSYLAFFLLAPVAAMLAGRIFGVLCDRLPCRVQVILRGKTARPAAVTAPAE